MIKAGIWTAAFVAACDQLSKSIILAIVMQPPRVIEITEFFNFVLVWNRGVSFGMLQSASIWGPILLGAVTVGIIVLLFSWLREAKTRLCVIALGLVIGGALGNLIDRVLHQAVVDFLDFHIGGYHWPAFNVADSAITVGVICIIYESLFERTEKAS